jgi:hypothetical protein
VTGECGRDALALAEKILASLRGHTWNNEIDGPTGPNDMPTPAGKLFEQIRRETEAA